MKLGFSLSPGGLLLPYHIGVLDGLAHRGVLDDTTPLAGASAGSIAVACHGCRMDGPTMVDATTELSAQCIGNTQLLVDGLRAQMLKRIGPQEMEEIRARPGPIGIAYQQLFPQVRPVIQTNFNDVEDLAEAVCYSSTFPFFSSKYPFAIDSRGGFPRLVVDGFFTVPRDRFGCPDFSHMGLPESEKDDILVDRTICVSCVPKDAFGLSGVAPENCISPETDMENPEAQINQVLRLATTPLESGAKEYGQLYEDGFLDAEKWVAREASSSPHPPVEGLALN